MNYNKSTLLYLWIWLRTIIPWLGGKNNNAGRHSDIRGFTHVLHTSGEPAANYCRLSDRKACFKRHTRISLHLAHFCPRGMERSQSLITSLPLPFQPVFFLPLCSLFLLIRLQFLRYRPYKTGQFSCYGSYEGPLVLSFMQHAFKFPMQSMLCVPCNRLNLRR